MFDSSEGSTVKHINPMEDRNDENVEGVAVCVQPCIGWSGWSVSAWLLA